MGKRRMEIMYEINGSVQIDNYELDNDTYTSQIKANGVAVIHFKSAHPELNYAHYTYPQRILTYKKTKKKKK